jgi:biopolymer transport protein ExbD
MAYKRRNNKGESPKLDMTPMIDVVFQLLIFFVVTLKQEDILSKLSAARPAPDPNAKPEQQPDPTTIIVCDQGFLFNGLPMRLDELDRQIARVSRSSKTAMVLVKCTMSSPHKFLVQALDICNKHGLQNLSILTM